MKASTKKQARKVKKVEKKVLKKQKGGGFSGPEDDANRRHGIISEIVPIGNQDC